MSEKMAMQRRKEEKLLDTKLRFEKMVEDHKNMLTQKLNQVNDRVKNNKFIIYIIYFY
jgi:hypothetical protein